MGREKNKSVIASKLFFIKSLIFILKQKVFIMSSKRTNLIETIKSEKTHELLASGADALIDTASDSEIMGNIPFVGSVLKTYQAAQGIRERMLVKKLAKFLEHPSQMSIEEKLKFSSQFEDPSKEENFGEQMLMLLEQAEDIEKPKILGKLLVAHVRGHFDYIALMRMSKMVNRAFSEDLTHLTTLYNSEQIESNDIANSLHSVGFLNEKIKVDKSLTVSGRHFQTRDGYELTDYGRWVVEYGLN